MGIRNIISNISAGTFMKRKEIEELSFLMRGIVTLLIGIVLINLSKDNIVEVIGWLLVLLGFGELILAYERKGIK